MSITMDNANETCVLFSEKSGLSISNDMGHEVCIEPDRVEEFMTLCRKVIDYSNNQLKGSKDAGLISKEG